MKRDWLLWSLAAVLVVFFSAYGNADVYGTASVHDGDTLTISGEHVRLDGIDAPELKQVCVRDNMPWMCGRDSRKRLAALVEGQEVTCVGHSHDRYRRLIGTCYVGDNNLNQVMVREGLAMAYRQYSLRYVLDEEYAHQQRIGIWDSEFIPPWDWRKQH